MYLSSIMLVTANDQYDDPTVVGPTSRPLSEPLKPLFWMRSLLEHVKCRFGPLNDFIFTFEPLFATISPQN